MRRARKMLVSALIALTSLPAGVAAQPEPVLRFRDVHRRSECLARLSRLRRLCTREAFSGHNYVQILIADFDKDGRADVAIRYLQRHRCSGGSHGCQTEVYLGTARGFAKVRLFVVSTGDVLRCRRGREPGIAFSGSSNRYCFSLR